MKNVLHKIKLLIDKNKKIGDDLLALQVEAEIAAKELVTLMKEHEALKRKNKVNEEYILWKDSPNKPQKAPKKSYSKPLSGSRQRQKLLETLRDVTCVEGDGLIPVSEVQEY